VIRVTRRYCFSASHRLHAPQLSDEQNRRLYGKCNNPFGHGHNYEVEVSVRGPVDVQSGQVVDRKTLDALVGREVLRVFHHRDLNSEIPEFQNAVPTSENLGLVLWRRLEQKWREAFPAEWPVLDRIRIAETSRNIFEVAGQNAKL